MSKQAVTAEMVRGYEAMRRSRGSYNYERVFWNSIFGIGLVGVTWVTIKMGQTIRFAQNPLGGKEDSEYKLFYLWIEGRNKSTPTFWLWPTPEIKKRVEEFRENPELWEEYKLEHEKLHKDDPIDVKALDFIDGLYARYGPLMPVGLLSMNVLREAVRVRELRDGI